MYVGDLLTQLQPSDWRAAPSFTRIAQCRIRSGDGTACKRHGVSGQEKQTLEEGWVLPFFIVTNIGIHELLINRPLQYDFMSYRMDNN